MYIFLNPPRPFWAIADTDIILTRSKPHYKLTEEEINQLDTEQRRVLDLAKSSGWITEINEEFVPQDFGKAGVDYIVTRTATEIQKRYVSRMIMAKDTKSLKALQEAEKKKEKTRESVLRMIDYALETIAFETGGDFYDKIQEIDDDQGGKLELELDEPTLETPAKKTKTRTRAARLTEKS